MTSQESADLTHLLKSFDAAATGSGDIDAGLNTLAAMACTLGNISKPGSFLINEQGQRQQVGVSLMVSGATSGSLITDHVFTELQIRQNNLTAHTRRLLAKKKAEENEDYPTSRQYTFKPQKNGPEKSLCEIIQPKDYRMGNNASEWVFILEQPPYPTIEDMASSSKFIINTPRGVDLKHQLSQLHMGYGLLLADLTHATENSKLSESCRDMLNGHIQGNLLIIDHDESLQTIAKNPKKCDWAGRIPWLVDGCAGPEPPQAKLTEPVIPISNICSTFQYALARGIGKRFDLENQTPSFLKCEFMEPQASWVSFLKTMEDSLPGITATARNLFPTLLFGFMELVTGTKRPKGFRFSIAGIEAFAKLIILRMANAHERMVFADQKARNLRLQQTLLQKLDGQSLTPRELTRKTSKLLIDDCRNALRALEQAGKVTCIEGKYTACIKKSQNAVQASATTLNV